MGTRWSAGCTPKIRCPFYPGRDGSAGSSGLKGGGVRIDGAVASGTEVSSYYDPMIAKVVTYGADREEAITKMERVFAVTVLLGIPTNIPLHLRVLAEPAFRAGTAVTTRYLEHHPEVLTPVEIPAARVAAIAAAAACAAREAHVAAAFASQPPGQAGGSSWRRAVRWRN